MKLALSLVLEIRLSPWETKSMREYLPNLLTAQELMSQVVPEAVVRSCLNFRLDGLIALINMTESETLKERSGTVLKIHGE